MGEKRIQENLLKELVASIDVFSFLSVQELLQHIYAELKKRLPRYSYRAFSHDLGFGETNYLHLICTQKRPLSMRSAQQVVNHLGLHAERRTWFLSLVAHNGARDVATRTEGINKAFEVRQRCIENDLTRDEMEFFGKWYHPVVRELVGREDFKPEPRWIAAQLRPRITAEQSKLSLELLLRLGYVECGEDGTWRLTYAHIRVPEGANHLAVHKYHQEMLSLSELSLSEVDKSERDLSALTVMLNAQQIPEVKQLLRETRRRIVELSEKAGTDQEIFQLNMQLFPVTGRPK